MVALALIAALVAGQGPDAGVPWPFVGTSASFRPGPQPPSGVLARYLVPTAGTVSFSGVTFTRASAGAACTDSSGGITFPASGVPCLAGGYHARPQIADLATYSASFDNTAWLKSNTSALGDTATAPDGTTTADTLTSTSAGGYVYQAFISTGGAASISVYPRALTGTQGMAVEVYDATGATSLKSTSCTASTSWPTRPDLRCTASVTSTTSGHSIQFRIYPGGTSGTGSIYAWGAQPEWSAFPNDYCPSGSAAATCAAEVATVPRPAGMSLTEGCAVGTITPRWSGDIPGTDTRFFLDANSAETARLLFAFGAGSTVNSGDGTNTPAAAITWAPTDGVRVAVRWSASGAGNGGVGYFRVDNLTNGVNGTPKAFSGFSSFNTTLRLGGNQAGTGQPLGAVLSSIVIGNSPAACGAGADGTIVASVGFASWGDSLTAGTGSTTGNDYPTRLGVLLGGRATYNGGIGGQTSTQIAARQGGVVPTISVMGDQIPTSGAVAVTALSVRLLSAPSNTTARTITGSLAGVPGTLARDASDAYTFTRTASGTATACPPGTPFLVDTSAHSSWAQVLWYGRNNATDPEQVKADIAASIAAMPNPKRFVVLSVLNGNYPNEYFGGSTYNTIIGLNNDLAALYPDNYIDVRALLVSHYDPGVAQDVTDHGHDVPPSSLRSDTVHLNDAGYNYVAQKVADFIAGKGW